MSRSSIALTLGVILIASGCSLTGRTGASRQAADRYPVLQNGKWGYINAAGNLVIPTAFDLAGDFSEGLALVQRDGRFGFINPVGRPVIEPQFEDAWYFSDGLAPVLAPDGWRLIDRKGRIVKESDFDMEYGVVVEEKRESADLTLFHLDGLYGFKGADGQVVIAPRFERAWHFSEGLARVMMDGRWGYIDASGKMIIPAQYDHAWDFKGSIARVETGGRIGYIDRVGTYVWQPAD